MSQTPPGEQLSLTLPQPNRAEKVRHAVVNGVLCPSEDCSGTPHTPRCRLLKWAVAHEPHMIACGPQKSRESEHQRLNRACRLILGRLQQGPATTLELMQCGGGIRATARIHELRQAGHDIRCVSKDTEAGIWTWALFLEGRRVG